MPIKPDDREELRKSTGGGAQSGDNAPNGANIIGALNTLERIAEKMDTYGLAYSDLPGEEQTEFDEAHEDLQCHLKTLSNLLAQDMVGSDDALELSDGNTVDLPKQATSKGNNSADLPNDPRSN
jgi:hypothetical protein